MQNLRPGKPTLRCKMGPIVGPWVDVNLSDAAGVLHFTLMTGIGQAERFGSLVIWEVG